MKINLIQIFLDKSNQIMLSLVIMISTCQVYGQNNDWVAPLESDNIINPITMSQTSITKGKDLYITYCAICHGKKGKGDGIAGMALKPRPANLAKSIIQNQSDGAIFWKMTEGKAPMAAYKEVLTKEQRWDLVNFIRSLSK